MFNTLSAASRTPELELDPVEAKALAEATAKVAAQYDMRVDPKTAAWIGLVSVSASIAMPRIMAYRIRTASDRARKVGEQRARQPNVAPDPTATPAPQATAAPPGMQSAGMEPQPNLGPLYDPAANFKGIDPGRIRTNWSEG